MKKTYEKPSVELMPLMPTSSILAGSVPSIGIGDPIIGGEGG